MIQNFVSVGIKYQKSKMSDTGFKMGSEWRGHSLEARG